MKIYNIFYSNFLLKTLMDLLINKINELKLSIIINIEEKKRIKVIFDTKNF